MYEADIITEKPQGYLNYLNLSMEIVKVIHVHAHVLTFVACVCAVWFRLSITKDMFDSSETSR